MSLVQRGCSAAPVEAFQAAASCVDVVCIATTGFVREEFRDGVVCAPHGALHAFDVEANAITSEFVGQGVPLRQVCNGLGAGSGFVTSLVIDSACQLVGKHLLAILLEHFRRAGLGSHCLQLFNGGSELLPLHINDFGQTIDERVGIGRVANAHALAGARTCSMVKRG